MDLAEIKTLSIALMDAVKERNLAEFELKCDALKIRICGAPTASAPTPIAVQATASATTIESAPVEEVTGTPVEAPLVGVFYSAAAPEEPPFIEVGQKVKQGDTLFIIEAMKTMNEITAPCDGTVSRIFAQNGDMVEYKQVLVVIE